MKKLVEKMKSMKVADCLAAFAMIFAVTGASSWCTYIFHDVDKPDLTKFRTF